MGASDGVSAAAGVVGRGEVLIAVVWGDEAGDGPDGEDDGVRRSASTSASARTARRAATASVRGLADTGDYPGSFGRTSASGSVGVASARVMRVRIQMLLVLVVLAAFGPGLVGTFVWDDHTLIVQNARLRDPSQLGALLRTDFWDISALGETGTTLRGLYWRPVVTLAYFVQYQLFGAQPMGYHAVSLALHLACALLTFGWLLRRLGPATTDDTRRNLAAAAGAMVFAVHPTRPETVTWIAGCTDLWMTFWMLLAAWRFDDDTRDRHGLLAALCTSLAVLSKEAALLTPLLFALDVWALDAPPSRRRKLVAVVVAAGATLLLRMVLVPPPSTAGATTGAAETLRRVVVTLGLYVRTTVWPSPPTVQLGYRVWDASGRAVYPATWLALGVVALAAVAFVGVRALRRARWRPWAADLAWFIAPLALVLNVVNLYVDTLGSMRLLYLPLLGASALLARGLASVGDARMWRVAGGPWLPPRWRCCW